MSKFCVFVEEVVFFGFERINVEGDVVGDDNKFVVFGVFGGVGVDELIDYIVGVGVWVVRNFG